MIEPVWYCRKHNCYSPPCHWCKIEQLEAEIERLKRGGWTKVKEQPPKERVKILAFHPERGRMIGMFDGENFWDDHAVIFDAQEITHWMPLPEPPEGEHEPSWGGASCDKTGRASRN